MFRMLCLASAGGALEFYDFVIFVFLAEAISVLFFPPDMPTWLAMIQTYGIFASGYIFRPLGGIVLAHFGDMFGRKRVFAFSILLMAGATLAVGLLPTYQSAGIAAPLLLVVLRIFQGIAIGGEVPGAWTFAAEHVSSRRVGFACGLVCAGLGVGIFLGASLTALTTMILPPADMLSYGWRLPFILGGVFGLIGMRLRRMLHETPVFVALRAKKQLVPELPLAVVVKTYRRSIVISVLCTWILSASVVMLTLMVPTILEGSHHVDHQVALIATTISAMSLVVGVVSGGLLFDRIGAARFFMVGGLFLAIGGFAFYNISTPAPAQVFLSSAIIGFSGLSAVGAAVVMVSCFPPPVRFSGVSFSYNVSYAFFGGLTPVTLATFLTISSLSHVFYLLFVSALTMGLGVYFLVRPEALTDQEQVSTAQR